MAEKKSKSKVGKIVTGIVAGVSVVVAGVIVATKVVPNLTSGGGKGNSGSNGPDTILRLDVPSNLVYDPANYKIRCDIVEHADGYNFDINGKVVQSETNEYTYVPSSKTTTFKVQATDSTGEYVTSEWSESSSYTIPQNQVSLAGLNTFVNGMMEGNATLDKVISVHAEGKTLYTTAKFNNGKVYQFEDEYQSVITSLKNIVLSGDYGISKAIMGSYDAKDYDSICYYLQSNTYKGALEDYKQQGYTFDIVNSQSYKASSTGMGIYTLFKLTKGEDIKYVDSSLYFVVQDTATESVKYTTSLVNIPSNYVRELSCTELTGDFVDYAKVMEGANQHTTNSTVQSAYTYDAGMSY